MIYYTMNAMNKYSKIISELITRLIGTVFGVCAAGALAAIIYLSSIVLMGAAANIIHLKTLLTIAAITGGILSFLFPKPAYRVFKLLQLQ